MAATLLATCALLPLLAPVYAAEAHEGRLANGKSESLVNMDRLGTGATRIFPFDVSQIMKHHHSSSRKSKSANKQFPLLPGLPQWMQPRWWSRSLFGDGDSSSTSGGQSKSETVDEDQAEDRSSSSSTAVATAEQRAADDKDTQGSLVSHDLQQRSNATRAMRPPGVAGAAADVGKAAADESHASNKPPPVKDVEATTKDSELVTRKKKGDKEDGDQDQQPSIGTQDAIGSTTEGFPNKDSKKRKQKVSESAANDGWGNYYKGSAPKKKKKEVTATDADGVVTETSTSGAKSSGGGASASSGGSGSGENTLSVVDVGTAAKAIVGLMLFGFVAFSFGNEREIELLDTSDSGSNRDALVVQAGGVASISRVSAPSDTPDDQKHLSDGAAGAAAVAAAAARAEKGVDEDEKREE